MGQVIWAKDVALQDEEKLWFRPGFDSESGCRHLLVSVTREGLDLVSTQGLRYAHIHFWQLETNTNALGHNVVYFNENKTLPFGEREREHIYAPNSVYEPSESIFFDEQMASKIVSLMNHEPWFSRDIFAQSISGIRRERFFDTLEGKSPTPPSKFLGIGFEAQVNRGTAFLADPTKLREAALELSRLQQNVKRHVYNMNNQIEFAASQLADSGERLFFLELQRRWLTELALLEKQLTDLLRIAEYLDRKAGEVEVI